MYKVNIMFVQTCLVPQSFIYLKINKKQQLDIDKTSVFSFQETALPSAGQHVIHSSEQD